MSGNPQDPAVVTGRRLPGETGKAEGSVSVNREDGRTVVRAAGEVTHHVSREFIRLLEGLSPREHPEITVDLRGVTALEPLVIHALRRAGEQRVSRVGAVRLRVRPGAV